MQSKQLYLGSLHSIDKHTLIIGRLLCAYLKHLSAFIGRFYYIKNYFYNIIMNSI